MGLGPLAGILICAIVGLLAGLYPAWNGGSKSY